MYGCNVCMEPVPQHCINVSMGVPGEDLQCLQFLKSSKQKLKEQNHKAKEPFTKWGWGWGTALKKNGSNSGNPRRTDPTSTKFTE